MPALRPSLKDPRLYFGLIGAIWILLLADALRAPERQLSARLYVRAVRWYQGPIRRSTKGLIRCRFRPTCSEYSIEAVQRFGIGAGMLRTTNRLFRCRNSVDAGTFDLVR
jgi:putative component of membrane protein insertase Oxa1/YidC/SpoIIIJ protein YidD